MPIANSGWRHASVIAAYRDRWNIGDDRRPIGPDGASRTIEEAGHRERAELAVGRARLLSRNGHDLRKLRLVVDPAALAHSSRTASTSRSRALRDTKAMLLEKGDLSTGAASNEDVEPLQLGDLFRSLSRPESSRYRSLANWRRLHQLVVRLRNGMGSCSGLRRDRPRGAPDLMSFCLGRSHGADLIRCADLFATAGFSSKWRA
jgi:hypothetical protein